MSNQVGNARENAWRSNTKIMLHKISESEMHFWIYLHQELSKAKNYQTRIKNFFNTFGALRPKRDIRRMKKEGPTVNFASERQNINLHFFLTTDAFYIA